MLIIDRHSETSPYAVSSRSTDHPCVIPADCSDVLRLDIAKPRTYSQTHNGRITCLDKSCCRLCRCSDDARNPWYRGQQRHPNSFVDCRRKRKLFQWEVVQLCPNNSASHGSERSELVTFRLITSVDLATKQTYLIGAD